MKNLQDKKEVGKLIESRIDEIGQAVAGKPDFSGHFEEACQLYEALKKETTTLLIERLEEAHAGMMGVAEREFYLAGLRDGLKIAS